MTRRAFVWLVVLVGVTLVAPLAAPYDPEKPHRDFLFAPPMRVHVADAEGVHRPFVHPVRLADRLSQTYEEDRTVRQPLPWFDRSAERPSFLLGADSFGRDVLSRLMHGAQRSIGLALVSTLGALLLGTLIGALAGYRGGWTDDLSMRAADFVLVLPVIYVVLVLRALLPLVVSPATIFFSMAGIFVLVGWPFVARGVRAIVSAERPREYVLAAHALGAGGWRIFSRHLLPACGGYLIVQATLLLPAFILAEATLSYVGLGFPEQVPTWGTMLIEAANINAMARFPWTLAPAVAIFAVVFAANLLLRNSRAYVQ